VNVLCVLVGVPRAVPSRIPVVGTRPRRPTDDTRHAVGLRLRLSLPRVRRGERDCAPVRRWFSSGGRAPQMTVVRPAPSPGGAIFGGVLRHLTDHVASEPGSSAPTVN